MYNKDVKEQFILETAPNDITAAKARRIFEELGVVETRLDKDLCAMDAEEAQKAVGASGTALRSWFPSIMMLRRYVAWCENARVAKGFKIGNGVFQLKDIRIMEVASQMAANPLHLQMKLNELFFPEQEQRVDLIYRGYFWLAFAGLLQKDALEVENSNIDLESMDICFEGRRYPLYREGLPAIKQLVKLKAFYYYNSQYTIAGVISRQRIEGTQLLRGIKTFANMSNIGVNLNGQVSVNFEEKTRQARANGAADERRVPPEPLMYHRIWLSGVFYRAFERERATGQQETFEGLASHLMEGKTYKVNDAGTLATRQYAKARKYREEYERWLLAFPGGKED